MAVFDTQQLVPADTVNLKTIRPFDPGEFLDNGDGTHSTERSVSFNIEGREVLAPSLWMTPAGPVDLSRNPESIVRAIRAFEERTGNRFPRFDTREEATEFSKRKSQAGGRSSGRPPEKRSSSVLEKALGNRVFVHSDGVTTSRGLLSDREILRNQELNIEDRSTRKVHPRNQFIDTAVQRAIDGTEKRRK